MTNSADKDQLVTRPLLLQGLSEPAFYGNLVALSFSSGILALSKVFTDRSNAMLLLWFTISVIVCLCMYVLVNVLFFGQSFAQCFGKETLFCLSILVMF